MPRSSVRTLALLAALLVPAAAHAQRPAPAPAPAPAPLGPADGHQLPPRDTGRVAVGTVAPDFTLEAYQRGRISLSQFRGKKNVILVFYRGHW